LIELVMDGLPYSTFSCLQLPMQKVLKAITRRQGDRVVLVAPQYEVYLRVSCCFCIVWPRSEFNRKIGVSSAYGLHAMFRSWLILITYSI
jgi:hypothetical protein